MHEDDDDLDNLTWSPELLSHLSDGWEPFQVGIGVVYLRRRVV